MRENNSSETSGLWVSLSELAAAKGIGKAAASERVSRLERQGLITTRPGKGRQKLVNLAEFDRVVGQVTDLAREQGSATRRGMGVEVTGEGGAYTREQARRMSYLAELARLELEERLSQLVRVDDLRAVIAVAIPAAVGAIDDGAGECEALRAAALDDDDPGALDRALRARARRTRSAVADAVRDALARRREGATAASGDGGRLEPVTRPGRADPTDGARRLDDGPTTARAEEGDGRDGCFPLLS